MARKRPTVPSVESLQDKRSSTPYSDVIIGRAKRTTRAGHQSHAVAQRSELGASAQTDLAVELAQLGDDSLLLPYEPTRTSNPQRPRTLAAGYSRETRTLRVRFRDGTPWEYYDVPPAIWQRFKRSASPGKFINRILNAYPYARGNF